MIITYKDFTDWKSNPVTKTVFKLMDDRIQDIAAELAESAGISSIEDRRRVGYIQGIRDLLNITGEDVEGAQEND